MPVLNLPAEFVLSNDTRREGTAVSTLRVDDDVANLYIGFILDNLPTFKNVSKSRPDITFTLNPFRDPFPLRRSEPAQYDPSISKYLFIKVRTLH